MTTSFYQQARSAAINNVVTYKSLTDPAYWMERAECAARELVSDIHAGRKQTIAVRRKFVAEYVLTAKHHSGALPLIPNKFFS